MTDPCDWCGSKKHVRWVRTDYNIPINFPLCISCRQENVDNMTRGLSEKNPGKNKTIQEWKDIVLDYYDLQS